MLIESIEQFKQLKNDQPNRKCAVDIRSDLGDSRNFMTLATAWEHFEHFEATECREGQITKIIVLD